MVGAWVVLVLGAAISIDLWVAALIVWSVVLWRRTCTRLADVKRACAEGDGDAGLESRRSVARFYLQTLILLVSALGFKGVLHWAGLGIRL